MTWIETIGGHDFDLLAPDPSKVRLQEMAHALARNNRFVGHTAGSLGYSVAEHELHVCELIEREHPGDAVLASYALYHDGHEAYTGDVSAPMKRALQQVCVEFGVPPDRSPLRHIERKVQRAVLSAMRLPEPTEAQEAAVKAAETRLVAVERAVFLPMTGKRRWENAESAPPLGFEWWERLGSTFWREAQPEMITFRFMEKACALALKVREATPP